jgi:hypothetical protein
MHDVNRPKRIHLTKGPESRYEENYAGATITPGMLIKMNSLNKMVPHSTAGGYAEKAFAIEDALQGLTIGDNYTNGTLTRYIIGGAGDVVYAILADGENVVAGDYIASNGDGYVKKVASTNVPVGIALEAIDASGSSDTLDTRRIRLRLL